MVPTKRPNKTPPLKAEAFRGDLLCQYLGFFQCWGPGLQHPAVLHLGGGDFRSFVLEMATLLGHPAHLLYDPTRHGGRVARIPHLEQVVPIALNDYVVLFPGSTRQFL